jgi:Xaa-Pro aminopeptidase
MKKRIKRLWQLVDEKIEGMLISSAENVRYLCGFSGTEGSIFITRREGFFLTDGRYTTQAREQVTGLAVITFREKAKGIASIIKKSRVRSVGYEARSLTVAFFKDLEKEVPGVQLNPYRDSLDQLRILKDASEIALLKRAAHIAALSLRQVMNLIRPGVREIEIAAELEYRIRKNGGEGPSFPFIVASGYRGALPHGVASQKKIAAGDLVVVDYGAIYSGYASDETCTFVVGRPTRKQKKIYAIVREAHDRAIAALKPRESLKRIDGAARTYIEKQGYKRYFNHGTGHGLGLSVHEPPRVSLLSDATALEGMVVTIEPGIYLPGWGGVRIEDTVVVTKKGGEIITEMNKSLTVLDS